MAKETIKPKLDERFIKNIEGKDFVLYAGLLDLAHQKGLTRIEVEILQFPTPENGNSAIVKAIAESQTGELFSDIGDANPLNCNAKVAKHLLRMSSTRAKARALRDFTNIGMTAFEELDLDDDNSKPGTHRKSRGEKSKEANSTSPPDNGGSNGKPAKRISEAQKQAILNLSKRKGITFLDLEKMVQENYQAALIDLSSIQASNLIQTLQKSN